MSTPPSELPPPAQQAPATQVVGQQTTPITAVPVGGAPPSTSINIGGRRTNSLAIVSLITSLVAPFGHVIGVGGITLIIISLVTGHMSLNQIKKTGESGAVLAIIGLLISYIHLAVIALVVIFFFSLVAAFLAFLFHVVVSSG